MVDTAFMDMDEPEIVGYYCRHMSMTSSSGIVTSLQCYQGCSMQPMYKNKTWVTLELYGSSGEGSTGTTS